MALPTPATPVAKSLHTLTVIQQVARLIYAQGGISLEGATDSALLHLGLYGRPDPYGLRARALELMQRDHGGAQ
jgi:hypothetical protein